MSNLTSLQSIEIGDSCFSGYAKYYYSFIYAGSFSLIGMSEWIKWWVDLPLLQSVKLGNKAFLLATTFELSNLPSLQSIEIGDDGFIGANTGHPHYWVGGASSFSLTGIVEWMKWEIDLPLLQSVKLGNCAFRRTGSFAMSNLTSLHSIEFGVECFNGANAFSLIGIIEWMKWEIDLPLLQSVKLGDKAFGNTGSFAMSNLTSLVSIEFGGGCFSGYYDSATWKWVGRAPSFSLIGIIEWMNWEIDLPQLQSVKLGDEAFQYTISFAMSNLTSLVSIEFGQRCFYWASSFSLIGRIEWMNWEVDLPLLQSVNLGKYAIGGDYNRKTIDEYPYNYNNTMIMKSDGNWQNVYLDLPSLISFVGVGSENYRYFGLVVFESVFSLALFCRYSFTAIQQHSVVEFLRCIFASFFKFVFIILVMNRCQWTARLYQFRAAGSIIMRCDTESNWVE